MKRRRSPWLDLVRIRAGCEPSKYFRVIFFIHRAPNTPTCAYVRARTVYRVQIYNVPLFYYDTPPEHRAVQIGLMRSNACSKVLRAGQCRSFRFSRATFLHCADLMARNRYARTSSGIVFRVFSRRAQLRVLVVTSAVLNCKR